MGFWGAPKVMSDQNHVGLVGNRTTSTGFEMRVTDERIGRNDFVQVEHEGSKFLLVIREAKRSDSEYTAVCETLGKGPKSPFKVGDPVFLAPEKGVAGLLGLTSTEREGLYLGLLRGHASRVYVAFKNIGRVFVVGKPGSGKSFTAGVMSEEIMKKGIPLVIIDVHGEYASLKIPADRKSTEFGVDSQGYSDQIVEFANLAMNLGADLDIQALGHARAEDLIVPGQCTIINLRGLSDVEQDKVAAETASKMLDASISGKVCPFYLILDEAHRFVGKEKSEAGDVFRRFAQEGRKFGANLIVLTQRPQLLDVTVRSLSGTWIIHRLTDPNDVRIVTESGGLGKEWDHDINWLESGEAVVTGEVAERMPYIVRVRQRHTRHGAPGFNPLDFVDAEHMMKISTRKEAMKKRLAIEVSLLEKKPTVADSLSQAFVRCKWDVEEMRKAMEGSSALQKVAMEDTQLHYGPTILCEATVRVNRESPNVQYSDSLRRLVAAESRFEEPDWRMEEVYGVRISDLTASMISMESAGRDASYLPVFQKLTQPSSVEGLKRGLHAYASAKLAKTILRHAALKLTSPPSTTQEQFRTLVKAEVAKRKMAKTAALQAEIQELTEENHSKVASLQSEMKLTFDYLAVLRQEIEDLRKRRASARKDKRGTLQLNERIYKRETRLARLTTQLRELEREIADNKQSLEKQVANKEQQIAEGSAHLDIIAEEIPQSLTIQPSEDEVGITSFQLLWIPIYKASVMVERGNLSAELEVWWNAANGKGYFGDCGTCGQAIDAVTPSWFCHLDLTPTCRSHSIPCTICRENTCQDHTWTCASCGKPYCTAEEVNKCEVCTSNLCISCACHCPLCGDQKSYDTPHVKKCDACDQIYCEIHYHGHFTPCSICTRKVCLIEQVKCSICGKTTCESHSKQCPSCGSFACKDHIWACISCTRELCSTEHKTLCSICQDSLCDDCTRICDIGGETVCQRHTIQCPLCGKTVCLQHTRSRRKLLLKTEQVCQRCSEQPPVT